ncbi:MAG: hypothetical protein ACRC80_26720 [Waterburya sp.]
MLTTLVVINLTATMILMFNNWILRETLLISHELMADHISKEMVDLKVENSMGSVSPDYYSMEFNQIDRN